MELESWCSLQIPIFFFRKADAWGGERGWWLSLSASWRLCIIYRWSGVAHGVVIDLSVYVYILSPENGDSFVWLTRKVTPDSHWGAVPLRLRKHAVLPLSNASTLLDCNAWALLKLYPCLPPVPHFNISLFRVVAFGGTVLGSRVLRIWRDIILSSPFVTCPLSRKCCGWPFHHLPSISHLQPGNRHEEPAVGNMLIPHKCAFITQFGQTVWTDYWYRSWEGSKIINEGCRVSWEPELSFFRDRPL